MTFGINVFDFGAKGDGVHDDTKAIQDAINYAAKRGGDESVSLTRQMAIALPHWE